MKTFIALALPPAESSDEALMALIQKRDEGALNVLFCRYSQLLRSVISRCVYDVHHSEDLLQEVFVEIWERAGQYSEEKGRALGWLITLARRRALDRIRRFQAYSRAEQRLREDHRQKELMEDPVVDGGCKLEQRDFGVQLKQALEKLPPPQADAVRMAYMEGLSQREIVARTGIPLGTIKTRIELGLKKLKSQLRSEVASAN